jgi:hypothetical protein
MASARTNAAWATFLDSKNYVGFGKCVNAYVKGIIKYETSVTLAFGVITITNDALKVHGTEMNTCKHITCHTVWPLKDYKCSNCAKFIAYIAKI